MDVKQLSMPGHASLSDIRLENLPPNWPDQQHQLHGVFPVQLALQRNAVQPKVGFLASTPRPRRFSHSVPATRLAPA